MSSGADVPSRKRLDSWKAVASHFGRDVTTVRRWERREGLPIHRQFHEKLGSIYAFTDELDAWWATRTAREPAPDVTGIVPEVAPTESEPSATPIAAVPAGLRASALRRHAAAAAVVVASLAVFVGLTRGPDAVKAWRDARGRAAATAPAAAAPAGVVVLPLVNGAGRDSESYFTDGMTTAVTAELAAVKALKVIANTSARRYRERADQPLSTIAHELGVDWIVDGSVGRVGDRVRITVSLTRAAGERRVWTQSFDRPIEGILDLQTEIGRAITVQILGPNGQARDLPEAQRPSRVDLRAYELHLRGEFHVEQLNPMSLTRAVDYFTQAVAADPGMAVAWAGLAKAELMQEFWGNARSGERRNAVRHATLKALAIDPDLAEAHDILGRIFLIYDRDWAAAETAFRKAIAQAPSLAVAHNGYSLLLQTLVRTDESLVVAARARELDPLAAWAWSEEGRALYRARRFAEAEERYRRGLALDPGFAPTVDRLAQLYLLQRRSAEARNMIVQLERLPSSRAGPGLRAWLAAVEGDRATALAAAGEAKNGYQVYMALGDYEAALGDLEEALADGSLAGFALGNPELDPIRGNPRFARIVSSLGLPVDRLVAPARERREGSRVR